MGGWVQRSIARFVFIFLLRVMLGSDFLFLFFEGILRREMILGCPPSPPDSHRLLL